MLVFTQNKILLLMHSFHVRLNLIKGPTRGRVAPRLVNVERSPYGGVSKQNNIQSDFQMGRLNINPIPGYNPLEFPRSAEGPNLFSVWSFLPDWERE